ncbi:1367_t:CDS:1, partial [Paraglomus occultum]
VPEGHEFAHGARHEANTNTSPRPLILSYENTLVRDLKELIGDFES